MKNFIVFLIIIILIGCRKTTIQPMDNTINLGVESKTTKINKVYPFLSNGSNVTFEINTTNGSKYNLQISDIMGNSIKNFGFTASDTFTIKSINVSDLDNGDYDVILTDIAGKQSKTNIIIKK